MPQYLYQLAYTPESLAAQIKNPQDRLETVGKQLADAVGAHIVGGGYSFGEYDVSIIVDAGTTSRWPRSPLPSRLSCARQGGEDHGASERPPVGCRFEEGACRHRPVPARQVEHRTTSGCGPSPRSGLGGVRDPDASRLSAGGCQWQ